MDAVLLEGDSIEEIYKELSETLHKDHLEVAKVREILFIGSLTNQ